ncbi:hypothetical protein FJT64_024589 [Amphibalanus amphitrite]|uniref:Uncharacterized protein n=1 Tax=Amphibalanus amphitrite TaxID=1232801 RepID=A0A6A4WMN0_AMPAM|nr:hypothetical protein FJT64_024589 [Amphibalanus amphitrite]
MDASTLKKTVLECLKDGELRGEFQSLIQEMVTGAVAEAMAARDTEIAELKDQLKRTTDQLNDLEQYSRRLCVNITGVPEMTGESTDQIVTDLAKMAGVAVTPSDIDRSHRIGIAWTVPEAANGFTYLFLLFSSWSDFCYLRSCWTG